jgi:hypothetical protein
MVTWIAALVHAQGDRETESIMTGACSNTPLTPKIP